MNSEPLYDPIKEDDAKAKIARWIRLERAEYADIKWGQGEGRTELQLQRMLDEGLDKKGELWVFLTNYLSRAQTMGLHTEQGRQAFGKFIVTAIAYLEFAVMVHGPMPNPGVPSGTIQEWKVG